jgi:hypothetical protein
VLKPYLKYKYQSILIRSKTAEKEVFLKAINKDNLEHLYVLNPLNRKENCFFYPKKSNLGAKKQRNLDEFLF